MSRPKCPECDSTSVVPIVYGMPGGKMVEQYERGEIVLGGCCISGDDPRWHCEGCNCDWPTRKEPQGFPR